jgi:predicted nucleic acid-binding protein
VILVDSSVWIEFLRATGSPEDAALDALLDRHADLATTDVIVMELLAGARSDCEHNELRRLLYGRCALLPVQGPGDYEHAAELYRRCRRGRDTIRRLNDCLIAVVAMRADAELLHRDGDFEAIARHTALRLAA